MKTAFLPFLVVMALPLRLAGAELSPIQQAVANLATAAASYEATSGSLAVAQAQLQTATATVATLSKSASASAAAVAQAQADLAALIGPTPQPAPVGTVSLLAVTSPATCAPCKVLQPVLDALVRAGKPITTLDGGDPLATTKWKVISVPTLIMRVDGTEVSRYSGPLSQASITDWLDATAKWSKKP